MGSWSRSSRRTRSVSVTSSSACMRGLTTYQGSHLTPSVLFTNTLLRVFGSEVQDGEAEGVEPAGPGRAGVPVRAARCTPTRSPRRCAPAARSRASSSTTARCTPWSSPCRSTGLISARETTREGKRPERTVYEITDGRAARSSRTGSPSCCRRPRATTPRWRPGSRCMAGLPPDEVARLLVSGADKLRIELRRRSRPVSPRSRRWVCPSCSSSRTRFRGRMLHAELEFVDRAGRADRTAPARRRRLVAPHPRAADRGTTSRRSRATRSLPRERRPPLAPVVARPSTAEKTPARCGNTEQGHIPRAGPDAAHPRRSPRYAARSAPYLRGSPP